jgi:hypothetical protein
MWFVSKPPFRQIRVGSGVPGNSTVRQSANAHWSLGIIALGSCCRTRFVSVAPVLSVLTAT